MKKIFLLIFVFLFLVAGQAQADLLPIVQCGGEGQPACTFCSFFDMITRVIQLIITRFVPIIAALLLVAGGAILVFAGNNPDYVTKGKNIITATLVGMVIIFTAFLVVGTILSAIGLSSWTTSVYENWLKGEFFRINGC